MDLSAVLLQAQSPDVAARTSAEQQVEQLQTSDYGGFAASFASYLADEGAPADARQLAGLVLKNSLGARDAARRRAFQERWLSQVSREQREAVHASLLRALGSEAGAAGVRRQAAQAVAKLAAIELPDGLWAGLIDALVQPMMRDDGGGGGASAEAAPPALRHGSVEALGFICEEGIDAHVLSAASNSILTAVVQGIREHERPERPAPAAAAGAGGVDVPLAATNALFNALAFVRGNFENEKERDYIMLTVFAAAVSERDWRLRRAAFECIVGIASLYYEKLACKSDGSNGASYIEVLFELTTRAIRSDREEVAMQALEFWSTVADEEISRLDELSYSEASDGATCLHIVGQALRPLLPVILECLAQQEEHQDEDTWNKATAAGTCLSLLAQAAPDGIVELTWPYIRENIQHETEWRLREAATLTLGSVLDGPGDAAVAPLVNETLPLLLRALSDPSEAVRDTTAWALGRVLALHPELSLEESTVRDLVPALARALEDEPRVAKHACWAISSLADAADEAAQAEGMLSSVMEPLATALLSAAARGDADESNLRAASYEAFNALARAGPTRATLQMLSRNTAVLLDRLDATFVAQANAVSVDESEAQAEVQGLLCGSLQTSIQRLEGDAAALADRLMASFLRVLGSGGRSAAVHEEALMAVGSLANALEERFASYVEHVMPFLLAGLRNWQSYQVCIVAVGVTGDLCRAVQSALKPFADDIFNALLQALSNAELNRAVKPPIIGCIGDLALALEGGFERYLELSCDMLRQAAASSLEIAVVDDDTNDWVLDLRQNVLDAYTGVINGLKAANKEQLLADKGHVQWVVEFCERVARESADDEALMRAVVGAMGDIAQTFGREAADQVRQLRWVRDLVATMRDTAQRSSSRETAQWAYELLYAAS